MHSLLLCCQPTAAYCHCAAWSAINFQLPIIRRLITTGVKMRSVLGVVRNQLPIIRRLITTGVDMQSVLGVVRNQLPIIHRLIATGVDN